MTLKSGLEVTQYH